MDPAGALLRHGVHQQHPVWGTGVSMGKTPNVTPKGILKEVTDPKKGVRDPKKGQGLPLTDQVLVIHGEGLGVIWEFHPQGPGGTEGFGVISGVWGHFKGLGSGGLGSL